MIPAASFLGSWLFGVVYARQCHWNKSKIQKRGVGTSIFK